MTKFLQKKASKTASMTYSFFKNINFLAENFTLNNPKMTKYRRKTHIFKRTVRLVLKEVAVDAV